MKLAALAARADVDGIGALEASELIGLLTGDVSGASPIPDLVELARSSPLDLGSRLGVGRNASVRLAAAFELTRRLASARRPPRPLLHSATAVVELCDHELRGLEREVFQVFALDGKHRLKVRELISIGSLTTSIVHPREVFRPAIRAAAAAVICVHNHPSGDPEPSQEDFEVTRRLQQAGRVLGVPLLDHVVIGDGCFVSMRERIPF